MKHAGTAAFVLVVFLTPARPNSALMIPFALFAPAQVGLPVHIVGFEHDERDIRLVLANSGDKAVAGAIIGDVAMAPLGCSTSTDGARSTGALRFAVRIGPLGKTVTSPYLHYTSELVRRARELHAGYLQAQFGVIGVYFADGTTWPARWPNRGLSNPTDLFDPSLLGIDTGMCGNVPAVTSALENIKEVVFAKENPASSGTGDGKLPAHLRFSCSLEGPKAICRMPLESAHGPAMLGPEPGRQR